MSNSIYAEDCPSTGPATRKTIGQSELDRLDDAIECLAKSVAVHAERLAVVSKLGPESPPKQPEKEKEFLPDFLARIRTARERVNRLEQNIQTISARLLI